MVNASQRFTLAPWGQSTPAPTGSKVLITTQATFTTTGESTTVGVGGLGGTSCQVWLTPRVNADNANDAPLTCDGVIAYSANGNYVTIHRAASGTSGLTVDVLIVGSADEAAITS